MQTTIHSGRRSSNNLLPTSHQLPSTTMYNAPPSESHGRKSSFLYSLTMSTEEAKVYSRDIFEWARDAYGIELNIMNGKEDLRDGVTLCNLASKVERAHTIASLELGEQWRPTRIKFNEKAQPGTFYARDNINRFITWAQRLVSQKDLFRLEQLDANNPDKVAILSSLATISRAQKGPKTPLQHIEQQIEKKSYSIDAEYMKRHVIEALNEADSSAHVNEKGDNGEFVIGPYGAVYLAFLGEDIVVAPRGKACNNLFKWVYLSDYISSVKQSNADDNSESPKMIHGVALRKSSKDLLSKLAKLSSDRVLEKSSRLAASSSEKMPISTQANAATNSISTIPFSPTSAQTTSTNPHLVNFTPSSLIHIPLPSPRYRRQEGSAHDSKPSLTTSVLTKEPTNSIARVEETQQNSSILSTTPPTLADKPRRASFQERLRKQQQEHQQKLQEERREKYDREHQQINPSQRTIHQHQRPLPPPRLSFEQIPITSTIVHTETSHTTSTPSSPTLPFQSSMTTATATPEKITTALVESSAQEGKKSSHSNVSVANQNLLDRLDADDASSIASYDDLASLADVDEEMSVPKADSAPSTSIVELPTTPESQDVASSTTNYSNNVIHPVSSPNSQESTSENSSLTYRMRLGSNGSSTLGNIPLPRPRNHGRHSGHNLYKPTQQHHHHQHQHQNDTKCTKATTTIITTNTNKVPSTTASDTSSGSGVVNVLSKRGSYKRTSPQHLRQKLQQHTVISSSLSGPSPPPPPLSPKPALVNSKPVVLPRNRSPVTPTRKKSSREFINALISRASTTQSQQLQQQNIFTNYQQQQQQHQSVNHHQQEKRSPVHITSTYQSLSNEDIEKLVAARVAERICDVENRYQNQLEREKKNYNALLEKHKELEDAAEAVEESYDKEISKLKADTKQLENSVASLKERLSEKDKESQTMNLTLKALKEKALSLEEDNVKLNSVADKPDPKEHEQEEQLVSKQQLEELQQLQKTVESLQEELLEAQGDVLAEKAAHGHRLASLSANIFEMQREKEELESKLLQYEKRKHHTNINQSSDNIVTAMLPSGETISFAVQFQQL
eukprot:m.41954 g.41954  ORF g.41954 m.41954 type:complete len:1074 (-) comp7031_c0_seq2:326-3547(-)